MPENMGFGVPADPSLLKRLLAVLGGQGGQIGQPPLMSDDPRTGGIAGFPASPSGPSVADQMGGGVMGKLGQAFGGREGLLNLGANLMAGSGPSPVRQGFGSILGQSLLANQQYQKQSQEDALKALLIKTQIAQANQKGEPKRYVVGGALVDADGNKVYGAQADAKPPESRTIARGGQSITQEWDPAGKKWNDISVGPRWEPNTNGGRVEPPSGYRFNPDGSLAFIPGGPADASVKPKDAPKPTEADKKNLVLIKGMEDAEAQVNDAAKQTDPTGKWNAVMGAIPLTGGTLASDDYRSYQAAAERWASNYLYLKSGAQAGKDEIQSTVRQFFPQAGEDDRIVKQKAAARQQEMAAASAVYGGGAAPAAAGSGGRPPLSSFQK